MEIESRHTEKAKRDLALLHEAVEKGNQQAFAELLKLYREPIFYMMLKMTGKQGDAEDLCMEVFGKAFTNIKLYNSKYAFSTWLFRIATNHCIDFMRRQKKNVLNHEVIENIEWPEDKFRFLAEMMNPEEKFIKSQKAELVRQVVETLKPRYRRLVAMRYFQEFTYEEIATELDLPLGTVKAQLFRAREFLYRAMKHGKERM